MSSRKSFAAALALALPFLAACGHGRPLSQHCTGNSTLQFKRIDEAFLKFQHSGGREAKVYWPRAYLESARYVLTGGTKGYNGTGAPCTAADLKGRALRPLRSSLADAERKVVEMEHARGVHFDGVRNGSLVWVWLKDGTRVPQDAANQL